MGVMRFLVHPPADQDDLGAFQHACLTGLDGRIFRSRVDLEDGLIVVRRGASESAKLSLPWPVAGWGRPVISTTSLRETEQPYVIAHELARGKLSDLREHWAAWEMGGMTIPAEFRQLQKQAFDRFARASAARYADLAACWTLSNESLVIATRAADELMRAYVSQRLSSIRHSAPRTSGLFGFRYDDSVQQPEVLHLLEKSFNIASVPISWKEIEANEGNYDWTAVDQRVAYCADQKWIVQGGPLINLSPQGLPDWLVRWKNDFLNLPSFVCDFIETAISRYTGLVRIWELAAYGNTGGALELGEDHRLALVARTLEAAKRTDSDAQFFIRIDRPWGEYLREGEQRLSPFQFADALVRSNLGLGGVSLEINAGYGGQACLMHDLMAISRLIDRWSLLGVQLHVHLACPSSTTTDPQALSRYDVEEGGYRQGWSPSVQAQWLEHVVPLLQAKGAVTAVYVSHLSDQLPHRFPHAGMVDAHGNPKLALQTIARHLGSE